MRESLGDLGFRRTKEGARPAARVWPRRRRRVALGGGYGGRRLGLGLRGRGGVSLEGQPCPSLYRWRGRAKGRGVPPQLGLQVGRRWREGSPPQVGFLLSLHLTK